MDAVADAIESMVDPQGGAVGDERVLAGMLMAASALVHEEPCAEMIEDFKADRLFAEPPFGVDDDAIAEGFALIDGWLAAHLGAGEGVADLRREWLRLFAGVGEPEVPSWATYYSDPEHRVLGRETVAVREAYRAFGTQPERLNKEPDDSLGLMLRFLAHLKMRESDAPDVSERLRLREAQQAFLKSHVLTWIPCWRYAGVKHARTDFYRGVVSFVFGLVRFYAATLGFRYRESTRSFAQRKDA